MLLDIVSLLIYHGLTGVQTGSCNVITINLNRLVQDWMNSILDEYYIGYDFKNEWINSQFSFICRNFLKDKQFLDSLKDYLTEVVERVHKYHIAYKTMLYEWETNGMFTASKAGYISMSKLYSTVGLNGINEAA